MRIRRSFQISSSIDFERKLFEWAKQYDDIIWLESNDHKDRYGAFNSALAVSSHTGQSRKRIESLDALQHFLSHTQDWLFGYFSYDLKNKWEELDSANIDRLCFPELSFFQPQKVILMQNDRVTFEYLSDNDQIDKDFEAISNIDLSPKASSQANAHIKIRMRIKKDQYFEKASRLLAHIKRGDVYEVNFCQEFYSENTTIDPWSTYERLNAISKSPFAAFMKLNQRYLVSASPERYLRRSGNTLISQPIKGTAARSVDAQEDKSLKEELRSNIKERAENIMIADLVRNDLSKNALKGTVEVAELCGVYSFEQVHQMITTIRCAVAPEKHALDLIRDTFPMGSMTGAPKVSAMKLIETHEETKRGLYSGALGYFSPSGDFDFNVVIRSILYNAQTAYVSYSVGSAITAKSNPEHEYQECLLKAKALRQVLESD
ncbi:MAG: aminodeoxychorismate synthase component I [Allomuricauda sp.]|nr:MAG: aminodeoxychorismate synthase component I [Allomuricauda sp.]